MNIPFSAGRGQPFDVVYQIGDNPARRMGFIYTRGPQMMRVSDFAPAVRVGGEPAYQEGVFNPIAITKLHLGSDQDIFEDDGRCRYTDGNVALYREGQITLASAWRLSDNTTGATQFGARAKRVVEFRSPNGTYVCVGGKYGDNNLLRIYDGQQWRYEYPAAGIAKTIKNLFATDKYLFVATGSSENAWRWDGTIGGGWTQLSSSANLYGFFRNRLFRALGNTLYKADANNNGDSWKATTYEVGFDTTDITDLIVTNGILLIAKPEGLYVYDDDAGKVYQLLDASHAYNTANFVGATESGGQLFFRYGHKVKMGVLTSVNTINFQDITPMMDEPLNDEEARWGHGAPEVFVDTPSGPVALFNTVLGTQLPPKVMFFNGLGWHTFYKGPSGVPVDAFGYSPYYGALYVTYAGTIYAKRLSTGSLAEYPDYNDSGYVVLPRINAGYPDMNKMYSEVVLEVGHATDTETVTVSYSLDGGTTFVDVTTITEAGEKRIPLGTSGQPAVGKDITLKLTLARGDDVTQTPVVKMPIIVRAMTAPPATYAYVDVVVVDRNQALRGGHQATYGDVVSNNEALDFLRELSRSQEVIRRFGHDGSVHLVRCSDLRVNWMDFGDQVEEAFAASMTFVEALTGFSRSVSLYIVAEEPAATSTIVACPQQADYSGAQQYVCLTY